MLALGSVCDWKDRHLCVQAEGVCECVCEGLVWVSCVPVRL